MKKAIKKGLVTVNDQIASTAYFVKSNEVIKYAKPIEEVQNKKLVLPLKVLCEDDYLAAIAKPAGILVSGNGFLTVANALTQNIKISPIPDAALPQPVHRLDYGTTGVLLAGKTSKAIRLLNKMFEKKEIQKSYFAITIGNMEQVGEITTDIDSKQASTYFNVLESVDSVRFRKLNLVQLFPKTGRRHQIRKHLSSQGNPILGDQDYGTEGLILKGKGIYLHAFSLKFRHPFTNEEVLIADEFPKRFVKIFKDINNVNFKSLNE